MVGAAESGLLAFLLFLASGEAGSIYVNKLTIAPITATVVASTAADWPVGRLTQMIALAISAATAITRSNHLRRRELFGCCFDCCVACCSRSCVAMLPVPSELNVMCWTSILIISLSSTSPVLVCFPGRANRSSRTLPLHLCLHGCPVFLLQSLLKTCLVLFICQIVPIEVVQGLPLVI